MKRLFLSIIATASLIFSFTTQAAPELVDPAPITVPAKLPEMQVTTDIKRALISRS